jgi:hypothetical protein
LEKQEKMQSAAAAKEIEASKASQTATGGSAGAPAHAGEISTTSKAPDHARVVYEAPIKAHYSSARAQMAFEARTEVARLYQLTPESLLSRDFFKQNLTPSQLARFHVLYAYDGLCMALEMLSQCTNDADRSLLAECVLKWGYRVAEQSLTAAQPKQFTRDNLAHDLRALSQPLQLPSNLWVSQATHYTLWSRYPGHFSANGTAALPFALDLLQNPNAESVSMFSHDSQWVVDLIVLQIAALNKAHGTTLSTKHLQVILEHFMKPSEGLTKEAVSKAEVTKEQSTAAAPVQKAEDAFAPLETSMVNILTKIETRLNAQPALSNSHIKRLTNAQKHFEDLFKTVGLFKRSKKQRHIHFLFDLLLSTVKDGIENLAVLFAPNQSFVPKHRIGAFLANTQVFKKLKEEQQKTLVEIDVQRGDEYLFRSLNNVKHPTIEFVYECYRRSQEAILTGEGATPSGLKAKEAPTLENELFQKATRYIQLVDALVSEL